MDMISRRQRPIGGFLGGLLGCIAGVLIGAVVGMLIAPKAPVPSLTSRGDEGGQVAAAEDNLSRGVPYVAGGGMIGLLTFGCVGAFMGSKYASETS